MTLERINPDELARPSGFAHAVRATGTVTVVRYNTCDNDPSGSPKNFC